jgi:hypothetical protein
VIALVITACSPLPLLLLMANTLVVLLWFGDRRLVMTVKWKANGMYGVNLGSFACRQGAWFQHRGQTCNSWESIGFLKALGRPGPGRAGSRSRWGRGRRRAQGSEDAILEQSCTRCPMFSTCREAIIAVASVACYGWFFHRTSRFDVSGRKNLSPTHPAHLPCALTWDLGLGRQQS